LETDNQQIENRGKPIKCRYCGEIFKIPDKTEKKTWQDSNCLCLFCGEEWCILPPTERKLKYVQEEYLETRDQKALELLIAIMLNYTESILKKKFQPALNFEDALEYYAHTAVSFLVEEYLSKPTFMIETSFAGYIIFKIRQALYGKNTHTIEDISLDYTFEDDNNLHELIADDKCVLNQLEQDEYIQKLYERICNIIEGISNYTDNNYNDYVRILSVHSYFKKGEFAFDRIFQAFGRKGKLISMKTLDILKKELIKS